VREIQALTMNTRSTSHLAAAPATALAATIGLGAAGWVLAATRMSGMDMGTATALGSFPFFLSVWIPMMAAMMLPGTARSALRVAAGSRRFLDVPRYVVSYLGVWSLAGVAVFAVYRPHGTAVAGAMTVAAGLYELTPLKARFRRMCRDRSMAGWELGLCCLGSSGGLMLVMLALGAMSLIWMAALAGVVLIQKLVAPRAAVDLPVALAILALGLTHLT
jgi:predicted metal-binding membrane protein